MEITPWINDENRIIYIIKGIHNYVAKIFYTLPYSLEEEKEATIDSKYIRNLQNIQEIEVYKDMKDKDIVDCVYVNSFVNKSLIFFPVEDKIITIDFSNWAKNFDLKGPFSIIVTRKHKGFITLKNAIEKEKINTCQIQIYFFKIMKKILYLNRKYNFVHGDLLSQNVLISSKNYNIKLFDFDLSTIGNKISMGQTSYFDFHKIFPLSGRKGFLFDFSRLFLSILYYYSKSFFTKNTIFLNNLVDLYNIYEDCYIESYNNAKLFDDWVTENGGVDNLYENVIKFINTNT